MAKWRCVRHNPNLPSKNRAAKSNGQRRAEQNMNHPAALFPQLRTLPEGGR
jgi:hypothetical protein